MAVTKITFDDKIKFQDSPLPEVNKFTDGNINQIKSVVNNNADELEALEQQVNSGITITTSTSDLTDQTDSDPGAGLFKFDNADLTLATFIYTSNLNSEGTDISEILNDLKNDDNIGLQQLSNTSKQMLYNVTGNVIDGGSYKKIPVTYISQGGGGLIEDAELCNFAIITAGSSLTASDERENIAFESNLDNVHKGGYITPVQFVDVPSNGISAVSYQGALDDGNFDFSGGSGESVSLATLNTWLDGLADSTWVRVWTITTLSRPSTIKRTINIT